MTKHLKYQTKSIMSAPTSPIWAVAILFALPYFCQIFIPSTEAQSIEQNLPSPNLQKGLDLVIAGRKAQQERQWEKALTQFQSALQLFQQENNRRFVALTANLIAQVYEAQGQVGKSLEFYSRSAQGMKGLDDPQNEGAINASTARVLNRLGKPLEAIPYHQQAVLSYRASLNRQEEGLAYSNWGMNLINQGKLREGLELLLQGAQLHPNSHIILNNVGYGYRQLGQYEKALEFYDRALGIARRSQDDSVIASLLNNMAGVYRSRGDFAKALAFYEQSLETLTKSGDQRRIALTTSNIGAVYNALGQDAKALSYYEQALTIARQIADRSSESIYLSNMAIIHDNQGEYAKALALYTQALSIHRELKDTRAEGTTLSNMGVIFDRQGEFSKALDNYRQSLEIARSTGDRTAEATILSNIGQVFSRTQRYGDAQTAMQQALSIYRALGEKPGERQTLSNLADMLLSQQKPELAIIFYKQSVNITEAIRQNLRSLSLSDRQAYTTKVTDTYRKLANLLLQDNRVIEAQQVLDLLKVQELQEYLQTVRGNAQTAQGIELLPPEQRIFTDFNNIQNRSVQADQKITQLLRQPQLTPIENQQLQELQQVRAQTREQLAQLLSNSTISALLRQNSPSRDNLPLFSNLQSTLQNLDRPTAILYPLILPDRLEIVLVLPQGNPIRKVVPIKAEDLNRLIIAMRADVRDASSQDILQSSQKLYELLVAPIATDLARSNIQTLIYAPDGPLRYVPLSALYDGQQWLMQKYTINNITATSLTNLRPTPPTPPRILAGAFTQGQYNFQVGDRRFQFAGLPFAGREVENLASQIPNTTKLLDRDFQSGVITSRSGEFNIIHLATHAAFVSGQPQESFVLFGDGSRSSLRDVATWILKDVDLVVLSACETGIGGKLGTGEEIMGFGYQMQFAGAKSAIASLWQVDDGGTQALMDNFYGSLRDGKTPRAQALTQAQRAMLKGKFSHPYYWSAFILIGNGL